MYSYLMQKPDYISPARPYAGALHQRAKLGASMRRWFGNVLNRWKQQRMIAALEALDDRTLSDIGLTRANIAVAVMDPDLVERGAAPSCVPNRAQFQARS